MTDPVKAEKARQIKIEGTGIEIIRWEKGEIKWFTVQKRFKDKKDGMWKNSTIFFDQELARLRSILNNELPEIDGIEITPQEDDDMPY